MKNGCGLGYDITETQVANYHLGSDTRTKAMPAPSFARVNLKGNLHYEGRENHEIRRMHPAHR
jgi:hypothetical protein